MEHGARECRAAVKDGSYCTRTNTYTGVNRCMYTHTHNFVLYAPSERREPLASSYQHNSNYDHKQLTNKYTSKCVCVCVECVCVCVWNRTLKSRQGKGLNGKKKRKKNGEGCAVS